MCVQSNLASLEGEMGPYEGGTFKKYHLCIIHWEPIRVMGMVQSFKY